MLQAWRTATLLKKTPTHVFKCEYWEIFKNSFFIKHLRRLLLKLTLNFLHKRVAFLSETVRKRVGFGFAIVGSASIKWFEQTYVHLPGWNFSLPLPVNFIHCSCFEGSLLKPCHFIIATWALFVILCRYRLLLLQPPTQYWSFFLKVFISYYKLLNNACESKGSFRTQSNN